MREYIEEVKELAYRKIEEIPLITVMSGNPFQTLRKIDWDIPVDMEINQEIIARFNIELDKKSCLGRVAQSAAIIERYFPDCRLSYAEVLEDSLRNMMFDVLKKEGARESILKDILLYEEPHAVILINESQYDPISNVLGVNIRHPKIKIFSLWKGICSSWLVSKAFLHPNPSARLVILEQAQLLCPGTTLVAENKVGVFVMLDKVERAIFELEGLLEKRPTARTLFSLYLLTKNKTYYRKIKKIYSPLMIGILKREAGL